MRIQLNNRRFVKFEHLKAANEEKRVPDSDLKVFCNHLTKLHADMMDRFTDLISLTIPHWVLHPNNITINLSEMETITDIEEQLLTIQTNHELMSLSSDYKRFWLQAEIPNLYPELWDKVRIFLIAFPSSYLVEKGFSAVSQILGKQRLSMDIVNRGDLQLHLTNIEPDLDKIVSRHQAHPSHGKPAKKNQ